jgi:hypothetical protein
MATTLDGLLSHDDPAVRLLARRDLLDEPVDPSGALTSPWVGALLDGQQPDGGFGGHPYRKWGGAHWRLVSLVELGVPAGEPRAVAAAGTVLDWLASPRRLATIRPAADGLVRRCASQEGNALAVCCRLGLADDPRVGVLAGSLIGWQWPDGGWNCDPRASGRRSSFHESLPPMWGLHEYAVATGDGAAAEAAHRTAELFLSHGVYRSLRTGEPIHPSFAVLHYPAYWHYDVLQALVMLARLGVAGDPRASDAVDLVASRYPWRPGGYWWKRPGSAGSNVEVVHWGRSAPSPMLTLNALRVLRAAGRPIPYS